MTIQRSPDPLFLTLWIGWYVGVLLALANPQMPLFGLCMFVAFLAIEVPAAIIKKSEGRMSRRDTLSEIMTWVQRKTSNHRKFARGWNAALLVVIMSIGWLLMRTVEYYIKSQLLAVAVFLLLVVFLWDHFANPDVHG